MNFENILAGIWPFLLSTGLIAINEMGDKSQLLAMAFATRMKLRKVLIGIFLALLALNSIAVGVGSLLASVPGWQRWVQIISSFLFLVFAVWTLHCEKEDEDAPDKKRCSCGEIALVFASFFFSEMGDKTQLVTVSLAARYPAFPIAVLAGSTLGMFIADGIGIFVGVFLHHKLPEKALKFLSAALFLIFGVFGIWQALYYTFNLSLALSTIIAVAAAAVTIAAGYFVFQKSADKVSSR